MQVDEDAGPVTDSNERREGEPFLNWLESHPDYSGQVRTVSFIPPRRAEYAEPAGPLAGLLERLEITPYRHQAQAFGLVADGHDLMVSTPTASGKSLCYQVPMLAALEGDSNFIYLAPTKALAADQLQRVTAMQERAGIPGLVASYDGDTRPADRPRLRESARGLLTNPDMLHHAILPFHHNWAAFLANLKYIVLDEVHSYRGVFGVHVANILRRLLRVAEFHGADVQLIAASATIGNPSEHFSALTGRTPATISMDTAPAAEREFIFWEPATVKGSDPPRRRSLNSETADLAARFTRAGLHTLVFSNSRKSAELLRRYAADQLEPELAEKVHSYRAGYTQEDRRQIEQSFRAGEITVLTATSALELGMDVGNVDAVILAGWPGSHMALWQRIGRAGRRGRRSLALLLPANDPLDEYYLQHPELILEGRVESAALDPFNEVIHPLHLACAAAELPLTPGESLIAPWITANDIPGVQERGGRWQHFGRRPHRHVSIRGTGIGRIKLVDGFGEIIGETGAGSAFSEVHPGAVYLHQGGSWLVARLDLEAGQALLVPHMEDWYTQPRSETDIEVIASESDTGFGAVCRVRVSDTVTGYAVKRHYSDSAVDERPLDLPEQSYPTQALLIDCSKVQDKVPAGTLPSAMHALEHTLIGLLPAFVLCERADIGGVSYPGFGPDRQPVIFIYDGHPGGVGYVKAGAGLFRDWLTAARNLLRDCSCESGCPRCVLSPKCGNGNQFLDRPAALLLADALLQADW